MSGVPVTAFDDAVVLVQLTDSHLFAQAGGKLLGMATGESLQRVVELAIAEQPRIDLLLATGDLSQDGSVASYRQFCEILGQVNAPARWCPGNHDELAAMREATRGTPTMEPILDIGSWRIILLDTLVDGAVFGMLDDAQLQLLDSALLAATDRNCLICLHHHPVPIGCSWMDAIGLRNADALFAVLDRHPQVRAVLWGHIHQEFDQWRNGVRLLASPSTGVQFMPGSESFQIDTLAPGYRWLRLHDDGRLETGVSRVVGIAFEVDYSVKGY